MFAKTVLESALLKMSFNIIETSAECPDAGDGRLTGVIPSVSLHLNSLVDFSFGVIVQLVALGRPDSRQ